MTSGMNAKVVERKKETEGLCNVLSPEKDSSHSSVPMEESSTCAHIPRRNRSYSNRSIHLSSNDLRHCNRVQ